MFYVYVLQSQKTTRLYIGKTMNLKRRFSEHNSGRNQSTKPYIPWDIIYYEAHTHREDMNRREKYLKTTQGNRAIKKMLSAFFAKKYEGTTT